MIIKHATLKDLERIVYIDVEVIGDRSREEQIRKSIEENRCLIACLENQVFGFLVYHNHFFDNLFIELVIVSPRMRRIGLAQKLIRYLEENTQSVKLFSSTNQSNLPMHSVFYSLGYIESGVIHNLDEDDPEIIYFKKL